MKLFKRRPKTDSGERALPAEVDHAADGLANDAKDATEERVAIDPQTASNATPLEASGQSVESQGSEASSGVFERLRHGLSRSRGQFTEGLASLVLGKKQLDPALLEALEEQLIMADLGLEATDRVLESLRQRLDRKSLTEEETVMSALT